MQRWKQDIYFDLEGELEEVKKKKKKIESKKDSSYYEKELQILDIRVKKIKNQMKCLEESDYYKKEEGFDILAYAVSQIEGKKYGWREENICFWYFYNGFLTKEECTMAYLVEEGLEEIAGLEIQSRFPLETKETSKEQKLQSAANYKKLSSSPSNSYIQLVFYEKDSSPNIRYRELALNGSLDPFGGIRSDITSSSICDKNYSYLPTLMERIEQHKITNFLMYDRSIEMTKEEIYPLVDKFVADYKGNQSKESGTPKKLKK